ncbi:MAG: hypothetical protein WBF53_07340 [Litorimonas sp.]
MPTSKNSYLIRAYLLAIAFTIQPTYPAYAAEISIDEIHTLEIEDVRDKTLTIIVDKYSEQYRIDHAFINYILDNNISVTLIINGWCSSDCSLKLLPVSDYVKITDKGFITLDENSFKRRIAFLTDEINLPRDEGSLELPSLSDLAKLRQNYKTTFDENSLLLNQLIVAGRSPHHAFAHSFARGYLDTQIKRDCYDQLDIHVLIDGKYLDVEFYNFEFASAAFTAFTLAIRENADIKKGKIFISPFSNKIIFTDDERVESVSCRKELF